MPPVDNSSVLIVLPVHNSSVLIEVFISADKMVPVLEFLINLTTTFN